MTLNQIIQRIKGLATAHKQINDFRFGDFWEFDVNIDVKYAACFLELLNGSISRTERATVYNFRLYFFDLIEGGEKNEVEVLSDLAEVVQDFAAMLTYSDYEDTWTAVMGAMTPKTEQLGDMVAGWSVDLSISIDFLNNRCEVPTTIIFENDAN